MNEVLIGIAIALLWALIPQWLMLVCVHRLFPTWPRIRQRVVSGIVFPLAVIALGVWIEASGAACPAGAAGRCLPFAVILGLAGALVVAAALIGLIDWMRHRP